MVSVHRSCCILLKCKRVPETTRPKPVVESEAQCKRHSTKSKCLRSKDLDIANPIMEMNLFRFT